MATEATAQTTIINKYGFHVRPSTQFMQLCREYASEIQVTAGPAQANGKSIMELMALGAMQGTEITITAKGDDAEEAVAALVKLVEGRFGGID